MAAKNRFKNMLPSILLRKSSHKKPGSAPGTVQHIGERILEKIEITVYDYDADNIREVPIDRIRKVQPYLNSSSKTWIKVCGLHDIEKLKSIWGYFDLHPLIQEDIVNTSQRPKVEAYENCIFFVLRMLIYSEQMSSIRSEQISFVLGENYVISFQETDIDHFKPILDRLSLEKSRIRRQGPDYLTYALIDTVVDHYYSIIELLADHIETLEDEILENPGDYLLKQIHKIRRDIIYCRKSVWPLRDAINTAIRHESKFITEDTKIYLRDVYDHMIQVIDNIENYRDMILGLHDMYISYVSNRMNEVMKVLTIIATIFIPLTFITGIYGMNFNTETSPFNMPELNWYWGYPTLLGVMVLIAVIMIIYFKRKAWF